MSLIDANEKSELVRFIKEVARHPLAKAVMVAGAIVGVSYAGIFIMNLSTEIVTAYKKLHKETKA